jgi:ABC-type oligopeptide transport system substrate-binding subunit
VRHVATHRCLSRMTREQEITIRDGESAVVFAEQRTRYISIDFALMLYAPKSDETKKKTPELAKTLAKLLRYEQSLNIAFDLDEDQLDTIAQNVKRKYDIDKASRSEWEAMSQKAMDVALQVRQPKNYPFEGAANIKYPLVTVAALQFGARAYPAIVDG